MKRILLLSLSCLLAGTLAAQKAEPSLFELNKRKVQINKTGMKVIGAWGAANLAGGVTGYFLAEDETWKRFHQMNAAWGLVNLGFAGFGYWGAKREEKQIYTTAESYRQHDATRRLFLLNAGLDGLYIGTGVFLHEHARNVSGNPAAWRGYGRSIMLQGAGLLLFDSIMYGVHQHQSKKWYKLLEGLTFYGNGIGLHYTI